MWGAKTGCCRAQKWQQGAKTREPDSNLDNASAQDLSMETSVKRGWIFLWHRWRCKADDMTWISLKITERLRFLKVMIFMESPLIIQFSFTDYSWAWILSNSVFPTAKLKLKLGYFKVNMFDEFMKLINFSFYCALFENNWPSKHQKATENKSHKIHRHATIELLSL